MKQIKFSNIVNTGSGSIKESLFLIACALVLSKTPFIKIPFSLLNTFFHELSHGIAALVTGGSIVKIELFSNGAGLCYTKGGFRFLVIFSGYLGSTLWGLGIYYIVSKSKYTIYTCSALIITPILTAIFYAKDITTWLILLLISALFYLPLKQGDKLYIHYFIKLSSIYIILDSIRTPLFQIQSNEKSDSLSLENLTGLSEIFWILSWSGIAVYCLYRIIRNSHKNK